MNIADRAVLITGANRGLGRALVDEALRIQGFLPLLARSHGAVVNVLSEAALAPFPLIAAYSISKAAAFSMTLSMRMLLAARGLSVHAVLAGPIDTDMSRGADIPKSSPESVARGILDGLERGEEEIFPDPQSALLAESWRNSAAKSLERRYAALAAGNVGIACPDPSSAADVAHERSS